MARRPKRSLVDELTQDLQIAHGVRQVLIGLAAKHPEIHMLNPVPMFDVGIGQLEAKLKAAEVAPATEQA
jgi:hypothetical protein